MSYTAAMRGTLSAMKKGPFHLSVDDVTRIARRAWTGAAKTAVASGVTIVALRNGTLVEYGPGAQPLPAGGDTKEQSGARRA